MAAGAGRTFLVHKEEALHRLRQPKKNLRLRKKVELILVFLNFILQIACGAGFGVMVYREKCNSSVQRGSHADVWLKTGEGFEYHRYSTP